MTLRPLAREKWLILTVGLIGIAALLTATLIRRSESLPYKDSFATNRAGEWTPFGGTWQLGDGAVYNRSDERGAKLVSGSPEWTDYQFTTDVKLIGHDGDVGVIVRLGDEERGVDSYRGYYIGLRSADSALVIGRADHGWNEGQPVPMLGGVSIGKWYRLRIVAVGCHIGAEATNIQTGQTSWGAFEDQPCIPNGKIGLRSMMTGGSWRNLSVIPAREAAWNEIRDHAEFLQAPVFPIREADYSRMRERYFKSTYLPVRSYPPDALIGLGEREPDASPPQLVSIEDVRTKQTQKERLAIRGVVTLTSPLYVQDSTGSIAVQLSSPVDLNLGDEVEIMGHRTESSYTPQLVANSVRLLWDRTLVEPISITSTEAASGQFDASLVEVRGRLRSKSMDRNGNVTLQLYNSAQTFSAVVKGGLSSAAFRSWEPGSDLAIRGICTLLPTSERRGVGFTIQMRATDDLQVLSGPPWWTGRQLTRLICLALVVIAFVVYGFIRLERWKMHAIIGERERLAHDMHDTLAQSFAGVGFHLQGLCNGMRSGSADKADVIAMLDRACDMVSHSHREASACIAALHPDADQGGDFLTALDRCAREMLDSEHRNTNALPVRFVREGVSRPLSIPVRDALFHVGREAITNMLRHAHATEMQLRLLYLPDGVILEMVDNGLGFEYDPTASGFGIRTMQRRCAKVRARIVIESAVGQGTKVVVAAPYRVGPKSIDWARSFRTRLPHRA